MSKHYVGDVGTIIHVETGHDLSAATTLELRVTKPSGDAVTWTGTVAGDDDTIIQYIAKTGDLDEAGTWKIQAYVASPDWTGLGDTAAFTLYGPFK